MVDCLKARKALKLILSHRFVFEINERPLTELNGRVSSKLINLARFVSHFAVRNLKLTFGPDRSDSLDLTKARYFFHHHFFTIFTFIFSFFGQFKLSSAEKCSTHRSGPFFPSPPSGSFLKRDFGRFRKRWSKKWGKMKKNGSCLLSSGSKKKNLICDLSWPQTERLN